MMVEVVVTMVVTADPLFHDCRGNTSDDDDDGGGGGGDCRPHVL